MVALLVAMPIAAPLARPIRRLTEVAGRIERGDLASRAGSGGGVEIERLGQAFNRLAETLERENRLRRDVAADISHELRTPVTGIVSRIEAAQDGVLPSDGDNLAAMHVEALRLSRLIEDVERLAEAEQPALLVKKSQLDLARVAARRADGYDDYFAGKGIVLERELESITVAGDAGRLEQIVDNLLSNALRYTHPGGTVTLSVRREGTDALLEVSDSGIGIAAGDLGRVFDRFWRGEPSRARATGGSGIGLAVVEELVRAHRARSRSRAPRARARAFGCASPPAGRCRYRRFGEPQPGACGGEAVPPLRRRRGGRLPALAVVSELRLPLLLEPRARRLRDPARA